MKPTKRNLVLIIVILLLVPSAEPWPGPTLNLDRLTTEASLIAVGQITSVQELGRTSAQIGNRIVPARAMLATLRVDQVLKGTTDASSSSLRFHLTLPDEFVGWRSVAPLGYRIFFLAESSGELKLANPYHPSAPAVPGTESREGTPIERVIAELAAVLESTKIPLPERQEAVYALNTTQDPAAITALKRVAEVQDLTLRLSVSAALLEHNDISTLQFAEDTLLKPNSGISPDLLHNLSYGIFIGVKDERAVPSLARLLHATNTETRRAAASALMHVGSTSCIDPLLSAIGDADFQVRYFSVIGLAEVTGQMDWRPNMDDFKSDQGKYLNHWRDWSQSR